MTEQEFFATRSWQAPDWSAAELRSAKAGRRVSVVVPALDEQDTVAAVIDSVVPLLGGLVDELVLMDSGSTDDTCSIAAEHGAAVVRRDEVLGEFEPLPGKGEVLWRSLAATSGDVIVFLDS
ncbi:MAG: glycosyltransferase, partial [Sciscionella sp.]